MALRASVGGSCYDITISPLRERNKMDKNDYYENMLALVLESNFGQVEQAAVWYMEAEKVAQKVAENLGTSLENGASVVSAFSPRERWTTNVAKAIAFSLGESVTGLSNNLKMANASLILGYDALKGQKTNAFARAIAGDENAVVVDVWMMRAAGAQKDSPNKTEYAEISEAIRKIAEKFGLTARTAQALIWILVRGSAL
jgi:hypothetical protein